MWLLFLLRFSVRVGSELWPVGVCTSRLGRPGCVVRLLVSVRLCGSGGLERVVAKYCFDEHEIPPSVN